MMNIRSLGPKESLGLNLKRAYTLNSALSSGFKATGIFVILLSQNGLKATLQKESPTQSHSKVTSETVVCRYSWK